MKKFKLYFFISVLFFSFIAGISESKACPCGPCQPLIDACKTHCLCVSNAETGTPDDPRTTLGHITEEFKKQRDWLVQRFFLDAVPGDHPGLLAAMELMTSQLTTIGMLQVEIIGAFFDAKHQLETQRLFQQMTARAHKDYHPDKNLCEVGTMVRSLQPSSRKSDIVTAAISKRSVERQVLAQDTVGADGFDSDLRSRLDDFIERYCDNQDNRGELELLCQGGNPEPGMKNRDVSYTWTVDLPLTLDLDFTQQGGEETNDERALFALSANLFSHRLLPFISANKLVYDNGNPNFGAAGKDYLDARALMAKRSVASNSFAAIAALKAKGNDESEPFIYALMRELGGEEMPEEDIRQYIGDDPSYFAQMEVLTKKIYQDPNFYSDLYDKPANVMRKDVSVQAATLMQKRDLYRSYLRSEMLLAVILETALDDEQRRLTNLTNPALRSGPTQAGGQ